MAGKIRFACFVVLLLVQSVLSQCPWDTAGTSKFSTVFGTTSETSNVVISQKILLDSPNVVVNKINITNGGELIFSNSATKVSAHLIWVGNGGALRIGSPSCRVSAKIEITLWGPRSTAVEMIDEVDGILMGTKGIGVSSGGAIDVHGQSPQPAWTRLAKHANQNDTTITLRQAVNWKVGDEIVIASTDYPGVYYGGKSTSDPAGFTDPTDKWAPEQNEQRTIIGISNDRRTITIAPLNFTHYGLDDMSAEVGLLTRNILIQGDDTAVDTWMGGHIMIRNAVYARFTGVELFHMGQKGIVGRYPIHFHLMGDKIDPSNRYIKDSATHHVFQRCVVIHSSHGVMVQNNVAYNTQGHCYFLEDGPETFNTFDGNLGILANPIFEQDPDGVSRRIIVADAAPSIFWIVNPNNTVTNNVAVEAQNGFWYALPDAPVGISFNCCAQLTSPRQTPLLSFKNNVAHSTGSGLFVDKGIVHGTPAGNVAQKTNFNPGAANPAIFDGFIAYKNRDFGVWTQSENNHVINAKLYDNKVAARMIAGKNSLQDSIVMIDTDNLGLRLFNRLRSRPLKYDSEMVGWQYYDHGSQSLRNVTFVNFMTNASAPMYRTAYAIQFPCQPHPHNSFMKLENIKYINSLEYRINNISSCYTSNYDNLNAVNVMDVDGSTTGWVGGWIVSNIDLHKYSGCVAMPQWLDTAKCPPTYEGFVRFAAYVLLPDVPETISGFEPGKMLVVPLEQPGAKPLTLRGDATKAADGVTTNGYNFATNLHNTRAYLIRWLSNSVSSRISLRMGEFAHPGEFVILVFPYPKSATLTFSGSYARVDSINDLVFPSYFYDSTKELLYVRLSTEEESNNGNPRDDWAQWAYYNTGSGVTLTILANCSGSASLCTAPASNKEGFQVPIPPRREQLYRADLTTCTSTPASVPYRSDISLSGTAYFSYDPRNSRLSYHIMHNIGQSVTKMMVQYQETPGGPATVELELPALPVAPVKGFTYLSRSSHKKLTEGKLRIVFATKSNPNGLLFGYFGCVGSCSVPAAAVEVSPCNAVPVNSTVDLYINGNFTKTFPTAWVAVSNGVGYVTPFDEEVKGVCGGKPIKSNLGGYSSLNIGMNGGTAFSLETKYKFLEFWIKAVMPSNGQVDLFVTLYPTPGSAGKVRITNEYINNHAITDQWTRVRIPLSDFNVTSTLSFRYIQFTMLYPTNARPIYYFDQIRFSSVPDPAPIRDPTAPTSASPYIVNQCDAYVPTEPPAPSSSTTGTGPDKENSADKLAIWLFTVLVVLGALAL